MKRPLKNLAAILAGDLGSRAIGFLVTAYLARVLDPSGFGLINIGFSVLGYLMLAATPGIHLLEARNVATIENGGTERVQAILSLRSLLAFALWIGASSVVALLPLESNTQMVIVLSCGSLVPLALSLDWFFHGKEEFALIGFGKVMNALVYGLAAYVLVRTPDGFFWVPVAFALGNVAAATIYLMHYRGRFGPLRLRWEAHLWKDILRTNVPVGVSVLLAHSALNLPPIVVGAIVSNAAAGVLSAALKVVFVLLMIDRVLHALLLPAAARSLSARNPQGGLLVAAVARLVMAALLPLTVCAFLFAPTAISFVFGKNYLEAAPVLQILLGYFFLTVMNTVFVCALIGSGNEREYTRAISLGSTILAVLIIIGTATLGVVGAALGIVLGELLTLILMIRGTQRVLGLSIAAIVRAPAATALLMGSAVWLTSGEHPGLQLAVSVVAFGVGAVAFRLFDRRELEYLREKFV